MKRLRMEGKLVLRLALFLYVLIGIIVVSDYYIYLYNITFSPVYIYIVFFIVFLALLAYLFRRRFSFFFRYPLIRKAVYVTVLAPVLITPLFRCWFRVPYVACHVCPRKCIFGYMRPFIVPSAVLLNVNSRSWCYNACSVGAVSDSFTSMRKRGYLSLRGTRSRRAVRIIGIALATVIIAVLTYIYFALAHARANPGVSRGDIFTALYKGSYSVNPVIIAAATILLAGAFFIPRLWCDNLCPIGIIARLSLYSERLLRRRNKDGQKKK